MKTWNTDLVMDCFLACAEYAHEAKLHMDVEIKDDLSPVTNADKGIEQYLTGIFGRGNVLGEETIEQLDHAAMIDKLTHDRMWIVDPIDGTMNFVNKRSWWAISIGYAESGVMKEGGIYLPERGEMMFTENGKTLLAETGKRYPSEAELKAALHEAVIPSRRFGMASCVNLSQLITRKGRFNGAYPVVTCGSCACSGMDLALGYDAVYVTNAKVWDMAGMLPCLRNLGFLSKNRSGGNLIEGRITQEMFHLEENSVHAFALQETNWIGISDEALDTIMPLCVM